jgi:hypothetical protein
MFRCPGIQGPEDRPFDPPAKKTRRENLRVVLSSIPNRCLLLVHQTHFKAEAWKALALDYGVLDDRWLRFGSIPELVSRPNFPLNHVKYSERAWL